MQVQRYDFFCILITFHPLLKYYAFKILKYESQAYLFYKEKDIKDVKNRYRYNNTKPKILTKRGNSNQNMRFICWCMGKVLRSTFLSQWTFALLSNQNKRKKNVFFQWKHDGAHIAIRQFSKSQSKHDAFRGKGVWFCYFSFQNMLKSALHRILNQNIQHHIISIYLWYPSF